MLLLFSHVLAFSVLFIDSLFDLFNDNDIPDEFAIVGILGGILLHGTYSYLTGSWTALIWSLGLGTVFSIYGWAAYWKGMWGGADAMILSMMGFAVPTGLSSTALSENLLHVLDLVFNFMISAVVLTVFTALIYVYRSDDGLEKIFTGLKGREPVVAGEVLVSGVFSAFLVFSGGEGLVFFPLVLLLFLLFEVLRIVEREFFVRTVEVKELEGGEVPVSGQGLGEKVEGLQPGEIEGIEMETIDVREGVPMVPAFLAALLLTDLTGFGAWVLLAVF